MLSKKEKNDKIDEKDPPTECAYQTIHHGTLSQMSRCLSSGRVSRLRSESPSPPATAVDRANVGPAKNVRFLLQKNSVKIYTEETAPKL